MPKDPYLLAQRVDRLVTKKKADDAIALVMNAPQRLHTVVVWNHLIQACVERGGINRALRLFNQLKKRGLKPNPQTYTLLLTCCARSDSPHTVEIASDLFEKLQDTTTPSLRHVNALLQVYANAGDTPILLQTFHEMPAAGPGAPDHITYTIVIKHLCQSRQTIQPREKAPSKGTMPTEETNASNTDQVLLDQPSKGSEHSPTPDERFERAYGVWQDLVRDQQSRMVMNQLNKVQTPLIHLDAALLEPLLIACMRTEKKTSLQSGLGILEHALSLNSPSEVQQPLNKKPGVRTATPMPGPLFDANFAELVTPVTFNALSVLCTRSGEFTKGFHYIRQIFQHCPDLRLNLSNYLRWSALVKRAMYVASNEGSKGESLQ
ncbi:hypothetical protein IWQ62_004434 [Dispira parvispora]|uniref:Pentatricopeptide repeat-containing protein n=1 Tax=Dispira parvispora TaxID=1520584 RepID=A0A9W8ASW8_9FUNG|nr:hypothetical protein IWQ62_004434 [Dispira parvispora]